jgi:hypothetical protein
MLSQSQAMKVQISFPVLPLVRWAPMTISDDFSVDSPHGLHVRRADTSDGRLTAAGVLNRSSGASAGRAARPSHRTRL